MQAMHASSSDVLGRDVWIIFIEVAVVNRLVCNPPFLIIPATRPPRNKKIHYAGAAPTALRPLRPSPRVWFSTSTGRDSHRRSTSLSVCFRSYSARTGQFPDLNDPVPIACADATLVVRESSADQTPALTFKNLGASGLDIPKANCSIVGRR